jgi:hypothetical protein
MLKVWTLFTSCIMKICFENALKMNLYLLHLFDVYIRDLAIIQLYIIHF